MTRSGHNARKAAARKLAAAEGIPYTQALARLSAGNHRTGHAIFDASDGQRRLRLFDQRDNSSPPWIVRVPSGRAGRAVLDRGDVIEQVARTLARYGWEATEWSEADPVPPQFGTPLVRNELGLRLDEVDHLYAQAGIDISVAHHAYLAAVAGAVASTGIPVCEVSTDDDDADGLRGGGFRIDCEDQDEEELRFLWRENRGWREIGTLDRRNELGTFAFELPGDLGITPRPEQVATAITHRVLLSDGHYRPAVVWHGPDSYETHPRLPADRWDVSPELERSLLAYTTHPYPREVSPLAPPVGRAVQVPLRWAGSSDTTVGEDIHMDQRPMTKPLGSELQLDRARWTDTGGVEVGFLDDWVLLRTVDEPEVVLVYDHDEWRAFLAGARAGEFDDLQNG